MNSVEYATIDLGFDRSKVSENALEVVDKLQSSGYDGYLVGGCVRDLLLGAIPKDFDVTTNASPEQIRKLFDRARIIGRRFKLVHVSVGRGHNREVIEVATYRAAPNNQARESKQKNNRARFGNQHKGNNTVDNAQIRTNDSGRILDDNVYGTIEADAIRRDFTVNALYYDPNKEIVHDFVHGMQDIHSRSINVIGDIATRFAEDPVRMLRVVRFQAKLGLTVKPEISAAIKQYASLIEGVPAARMFEEVLKLFHHQAAVKTWQELCNTPLARYLFPQTISSMNSSSDDRLESLILASLKNTDNRVSQDLPVIPGFLFSVLLWGAYNRLFTEYLQRGAKPDDASWDASEKVFKLQGATVSVPWRAKAPAIDIWKLQDVLERRAKKSIPRVLGHRWFRAAYDFLMLRSHIGEVDAEIVQWWTEKQESDEYAKYIHTRGSQKRHYKSASASTRSARNNSGKSAKSNQLGAKAKSRSRKYKNKKATLD